ncbi:6-pyruvoyltetrahydropterin synthase [Bdellovibrio bacteriovorus W]|nr:6-pyruvoyltetrahydropterin synthase [Bdellovibrio bacteriovorus W]
MILEITEIFSSAHYYEQKLWDEKQNREAFGACYTKYGHGHNYKVIAGFQLDESDLSENFLKNSRDSYQNTLGKICSVLDHQHLNFDIQAFADKNPTTENIALYLKEELLKVLPSNVLKSLRLYEMDDLWVEIQI